MNMSTALEIYCFGTSEGVKKGWDTRGRKPGLGRSEIYQAAQKVSKDIGIKLERLYRYKGVQDRWIAEVTPQHAQRTSELVQALAKVKGVMAYPWGRHSVAIDPIGYAVQAGVDGSHERIKLPVGLSKKQAWQLAIKKAKRDFRGMKYNEKTGGCILTNADVNAEIGVPGSSQYPNQIEPRPENNVPSLKKHKRIKTDREQEDEEEEIMPDAAAKRKQYRRERVGKSAAPQVW